MADIGLNQKISAGSREFHLQTSTLVEDGMIRTEVFEKGRVLFVANHQFERRGSDNQSGAESRVRQFVDKFHQSIIEEIDSLFEISEKIMNENLPAAHEKLGQVFLYSHIFDKAERHFQRALDQESTRYSSYVYLARVYYMQKSYHPAYEILEKLRQQGIKYPDLFNLLGLVMLAKSNFRQAMIYFKEALKKNPGYIEAYYNLAETILTRLTSLLRTNAETEHKQSLGFLRAILKKVEQNGDIDDRMHSAQVLKALQTMDASKALQLMRERREQQFLRKVPPEVIGYKFFLRLLYSETEMSKSAMESYERQISESLQQNPAFPDLWHYLALIHLMQCRQHFLDGLDNFREATRINPQFEKALKNLRLVENDGREFLQMIKGIV